MKRKPPTKPRAPHGRSEVIGLEYAPHDDAPAVSLHEQGPAAQRVIRTAERFSVPIVEDPELVAALAALQLDCEIPPYLYRAVALLFNQIRKFPSGS